jgi:hypothetical protein
VQKMLNSLRTADPFETWHKNRSSLKVVLFVFNIFKMVAPIPIFLAYLVPLDVDVVPIKFHQFLFGE